MNKPLTAIAKHQAKRDAVYDVASVVFAQYGFRRTTMNDIAKSAGISRPALYLMFDNKEDLFQGLAAHRLDLAIDSALSVHIAAAELPVGFLRACWFLNKYFMSRLLTHPMAPN